MVKIPFNLFDVDINQNQRDDINKMLTRGNTSRFTVYNPPFLPYRITFHADSYDNMIVRQLNYVWQSGATTDQKYYIIRKDNGQKVLIHSFTQGVYGSPPVEHIVTIDASLQVQASALIFESANGAGDFPDWLEVYGDYTAHTWPAVTITKPSISELFGVVIKPWDQAAQYYPEKIPNLLSLQVKRVRLYNGYPDTHDGSGNMVLNGGWKQADNANLLKQNGVLTDACYLDYPYYPWSGQDRTDPNTFAQLASDIAAMVTHAKNNGDYLEAIEPGNELNRWYGANPSVEYMNGAEIAALCSKCYDAAKAVNPNIKFVLPGLASVELDIWYQMKDWVIQHRGYLSNGEINWPFDVYSYHSYSSMAGQRAGNPGGIPPELGMATAAKNLNTFRKRFAKLIKLRVGESGWDINSASPLNAPAFGSYSAQQTSAMWTAREVMILHENEHEYLTYYRIAQDYPNSVYDASGEIFATMALVRQEYDGTQQTNGTTTGLGMHRTLTGDYFRQLAILLSGYTFAERLAVTDPNLNVLRFTNGTSDLYALWTTETMAVPADSTQRPTFTPNTIAYNLNVSGTRFDFVDNGGGVMTSQVFNAGNVAANSKPFFVLASGGTTPTPPSNFDLIAETAAVVIAKQTVSFQAAGLDVTNTRVVYEVGSRMRSWKPDRQINAITQFEAGKAYYIIPRQNMAAKTLLMAPPFDGQQSPS